MYWAKRYYLETYKAERIRRDIPMPNSSRKNLIDYIRRFFNLMRTHESSRYTSAPRTPNPSKTEVEIDSEIIVTTRDGTTYSRPAYTSKELKVVRAGGKPRGTQTTPRQRRRVYRRDGGVCQAANCGVHLDEDGEWHADHIVPRSLGGPTTMNNLQLLCGPCNRRKGTKIGRSRG